MRWRFLGSIVVLMAAIPGFSQEPGRSFEVDVLPILNAHCLQCHGGVHQKDGLDLRTLSAVMKGGKSGPAVVAGKAEESLLWKKVARDEMPKTDNKVSAANKKILREWIDSGASGTKRSSGAVVTQPAKKPSEVAAIIDSRIDRKLAAEKIPASPRSSDAEFLRRAFIDIVGKPPTAKQTDAFLADGRPGKRAALIDSLLASEDFGKHFAERFVNLFRQISVNQSEWEPDRFQAWLAERYNAGNGWDAIVRELFSVSGPLAENPHAAFYYYNSDMQGRFEPKIMTGNLAQVFLGVQLQCAECHDHPFADYKQTDFWGIAAFFSSTSTPNNPPPTRAVRDNIPKTPPKTGTKAMISIPSGEARNAGTRVPAKFLDGGEPTIDWNQTLRLPLAEWLGNRENRQFARASVNRLWAHFFARGFVNPLNDFGDHNAASHPELLEELASEFAASNFDLKHMIRSICLSEAYLRTSRAVPGNDTTDADPYFARMASKVLTAEQLYDALCIALEVNEILPPVDPKKKPNPKAPPGPSPRSEFVKFFRGPGEVDEPTELKLGVPHVLRLMNESHFNLGGKLAERVEQSAASPGQGVDQIFRAVISRPATTEERDRFAAFVARQPSPLEGYRRVIWILLNSTDFSLNN